MTIPHIRDFKDKHVHMIGIGGSSMSGLAEMLLKQGYHITGSDNAHSHAVERLEAQGVQVFIGHDARNVQDADVLVYSAAIHPDNPERAWAFAHDIPQIERAALLGQLMEGHRDAVCVSGTHGKTTTSSMIGQMLLDCGLDPAVHIGGRLDALGGGTRIGSERVFVAEACEYAGSFLHMRPTVAVVLNIEEDHLDYYKDIQHIEEAFFNFCSLLPESGLALGCGDDQRVVRLLARLQRRHETFGFGADCDWRAENVTIGDLGRPDFDVLYREQKLCHVKLGVAGRFNIVNALAALAAVHALGADMTEAAASLNRFAGAHRRFEHTGDIDGVHMYHDYGHNPTEMRGAISVACQQQANRVWAVMQPHTYSRVKTLFQDYLTCTEAADFTLVTDIFAARETDPGDINSQMLVDGMRAHGVDAVLTPTFEDTEAYLRAHWQPDDLVLTMGCGNINLLNEQMQKHGDTPR
ncbi:MAG: UDP-N-acetylmuramate--L-alanine ligase [Clostridia bacterium]|nr:UDP-N-acetylmuramate--L-alanine ligase [Clostridia bacterium]